MLESVNFQHLHWFHKKPKKLDVKPHYEYLIDIKPLRSHKDKSIVGVMIMWRIRGYAGKDGEHFLGYACQEDFLLAQTPAIVYEEEATTVLNQAYLRFKVDFESRTLLSRLDIKAPTLEYLNIDPKVILKNLTEQ
jgi:hypothetical protein